jgi:hypothetical protein
MNIGPHTEAAIKSINAGNSNGTFSSGNYKTDPQHPKFNMMQRVREEATGKILLILGTPADRYIIDDTNEPAYLMTEPPASAWGDEKINNIVIVTQKKLEKPGAYTAVAEVVGRGMNPAIIHVDEDGSGNGKPISELVNACPKTNELGVRD